MTPGLHMHVHAHTHVCIHTPKSKRSKLNAQGLSKRLCGLQFSSLLWESHSLTSGLHSWKTALTQPAAHVPSVPQEALRKIITTLAMKNEETQTFIYSLKQMLLNVEVSSLTCLQMWVQGGGQEAPLCLLETLPVYIALALSFLRQGFSIVALASLGLAR